MTRGRATHGPVIVSRKADVAGVAVLYRKPASRTARELSTMEVAMLAIGTIVRRRRYHPTALATIPVGHRVHSLAPERFGEVVVPFLTRG